MSALHVAAVDLGATSGRVMTGEVSAKHVEVHEVHRFPNGPVRLGHGSGSTLYWDILGIYRESLVGLQCAQARSPLAGVGVDSWAVDYGLLGGDGALLGNPVNYRDARTEGVMERVLKSVSQRELYDVTGLQQLPFNTIYQLVSALGSPMLDAAETMLMIPDLVAYWLTGEVGVEATNASTTQMFDLQRRAWAWDLVERVGVPSRILPRIREAGDVIGPVLPVVAQEAGLGAALPVIAVGTHDTAAAVVGAPIESRERAAYISSGTWSLVGVELDVPVLSDAAMEANFTNEGGVDGTVRFLKNVMGLWVLSEAMRTWVTRGEAVELRQLLWEAAEAPAFRCVVDVDAPDFLPPGDMAARLRDAANAGGQPVPATKGEVVRCILESLALVYRRNVRLAAQLSGRTVDVVHVVGGGVHNELLCQLTADACGVTVLAGPVEAAALGNVLVQARTLGAPVDDLDAMRRLVRRSHRPRRYEPRGSQGAWDELEDRLRREVDDLTATQQHASATS